MSCDLKAAEELLAWMRARGVLHAEVDGVVLTLDPGYQEASGEEPARLEDGDDVEKPDGGAYEDPMLWSEDGDVEIPRLHDLRGEVLAGERA